jgi:hypothetical protein
MALEAALFVLIVALPLAFFPQSRDAVLDVKILLLAGGRLLRRGSATSSRPSRTTRHGARRGARLDAPRLIDAVRRSLAAAPRSERA